LGFLFLNSFLFNQQECPSDDLNEVIKEAERSRSAAFSELLRRKEIEREIDDTLKRVSIMFKI
jgi:hypothetical protein